ncbi:Rieske (2Fe-2S) protein [Ktedonosporobacter rubrisoli]|uniref:Rieske (2Fe-2S) protein n=2 Tax=Ktedonosporobacter rubrisoli TaxID=2509675 RepID=A0A4P6K5H1_KTERU|nr:Rieske (2Fe-2S) protein [Ktedonosporobacter rubrisoli]
MVPAEVPADWHFVTTLAQLGKEAVFFVADTIVGYVLRNDDDDDANSEGPAAPKEPVVALSAACTHMGCIVQWHDNDRHFHCPCHGGLFTEYGQPANKQGGLQYLKALPSLDVRVVDGKVYVRVPSAPLK